MTYRPRSASSLLMRFNAIVDNVVMGSCVFAGKAARQGLLAEAEYLTVISKEDGRRR